MGGQGSGRWPKKQEGGSVAGDSAADANLKKFRKWMLNPPKGATESRLEKVWEATFERATVSRPGAPASATAQELLLAYAQGKPLQAIAMEVTKSREEMMDEIKETIEYMKGIKSGSSRTVQ